jgi:hypothetical protein
MMPRSKKVKFDRPPVEDEKPETYQGGLEQHAKSVEELCGKIVDAAEPYNTAVILDSLETVMRGAVTLMGEEEGQMFEDVLLVFHRKLAAMTILRSILGGKLDVMKLMRGGAERKQSLDDLLKDMEAAASPKETPKDK